MQRHENTMVLPHPLDRVMPDETLKEINCINCGEVFELDIDSWAETENYTCDPCKSEIKNNKTKKIMKLKNQVCSLEYAKKLKELGVEQGSIFNYVDNDIRFAGKVSIKQVSVLHQNSEIISAFTVAELGEMLPYSSGLCDDDDDDDELFCRKEEDGWRINYQGSIEKVGFDDDFTEITEADARAKMLIYLIENKLIKL